MSVNPYHSRFVDALNGDDLHVINKLVNDRIAASLGAEAYPTLPTTDIHEYILSLGYGDKPYEGIATGFDEIDELIGGLQRFTLLAARAGAGKTTLAVQLALGALQTSETPILFYSYEMSRRDIFTAMIQTLRRGTNHPLTRRELIINGNRPVSTASGEAISDAATQLENLAEYIFVIDTTDGEATINRMATDIEQVKNSTGAEDVVVVIDSIQDLVVAGAGGATAAEAELAQHIVELQLATNATILAISQKAKAGSFDDPYAGVLGSVSWLHKPTCVLELASIYDLIRQLKDKELALTFSKLADTSDVPNPTLLKVLKGRNNGHGHVALKHYGRHGYFDIGRVRDFDNGDTSLYDLLGITN